MAEFKDYVDCSKCGTKTPPDTSIDDCTWCQAVFEDECIECSICHSVINLETAESAMQGLELIQTHTRELHASNYD